MKTKRLFFSFVLLLAVVVIGAQCNAQNNNNKKPRYYGGTLPSNVRPATAEPQTVDVPEKPKAELLEEVKEEEEEVFDVVESSPMFIGGIDSMYRWIGRNLKYPAIAEECGVQGRVIVSFVVEKDGSITQAKVLRDIGSGCGQAAINMINKMPRWKPGMQRGRTVRVRYTLPVTFRLQ